MLDDNVKLQWVDKYAPKTIDDIVLTENLQTYFKNSFAANDISNMTLAGSPGIGKTTIANIIANTLNASVLFIPCGLKGNIDTIRSEVKDFVDAFDFEQKLKIIIFDEADQLSGGNADSSAQKALRSIMCEANSDCRFILTCNYENKIIPAIKSRCPVIHLSFTAQDLLKRLINILTTEKIKFTKAELSEFINTVLKTYYPDIRAIITHLQNLCVSGKLVLSDNKTQEKEVDKFIDELFTYIHENKSLRSIMSFVDKNKTVFSNDYNMLACKMLEYNTDLYTVKRVEKLVECIYRLNVVADPSVQFCGFICIMLNTDYNK